MAGNENQDVEDLAALFGNLQLNVAVNAGNINQPGASLNQNAGVVAARFSYSHSGGPSSLTVSSGLPSVHVSAGTPSQSAGGQLLLLPGGSVSTGGTRESGGSDISQQNNTALSGIGESAGGRDIRAFMFHKGTMSVASFLLGLGFAWYFSGRE